MIAAVILPARTNFHQAVAEAITTRHAPESRLYTDGERVAWLPRRLPGWFRVGAIERAAA